MKRLIALLFITSYSISGFTDNVENQEAVTGKASYYAHKFHKRKTASGKLYHEEELVCAHKEYPFGTKLLVKNLHNQKTIVVTVIDRGPFIEGRIIDLSYAAAQHLDFIQQGITSVEISICNDSIIEYTPDCQVIVDQIADTILIDKDQLKLQTISNT